MEFFIGKCQNQEIFKVGFGFGIALLFFWLFVFKFKLHLLLEIVINSLFSERPLLRNACWKGGKKLIGQGGCFCVLSFSSSGTSWSVQIILFGSWSSDGVLSTLLDILSGILILSFSSLIFVDEVDIFLVIGSLFFDFLHKFLIFWIFFISDSIFVLSLTRSGHIIDIVNLTSELSNEDIRSIFFKFSKIFKILCVSYDLAFTVFFLNGVDEIFRVILNDDWFAVQKPHYLCMFIEAEGTFVYVFGNIIKRNLQGFADLFYCIHFCFFVFGVEVVNDGQEIGDMVDIVVDFFENLHLLFNVFDGKVNCFQYFLLVFAFIKFGPVLILSRSFHWHKLIEFQLDGWYFSISGIFVTFSLFTFIVVFQIR